MGMVNVARIGLFSGGRPRMGEQLRQQYYLRLEMAGFLTWSL